MSDVAASGGKITGLHTASKGDSKPAYKAAARTTSGWVVFAAVMMIVAGASRILDAIWAFQYNRALPENLQGAVFGSSLNTYGWMWLIVGAVLIVAGVLVWLADSKVGRWIGVVSAGAIGITSMPMMAYYPGWSILYMGAAALVIYALVAHGDPTATG